MKLRVLCSALAALMMTGTAAAAVVDVNLGDDSFSGKFSGPLPKMGGSGAQYDLGVLVRPDDDPDLLQVYGGFLLTGDAGARDFDLAAGLGGRLIYIDRDVVDGGVFALGGQLEARLPRRMGKGAWRFGELAGYTSTGAGTSLAPVRLNCPAEITVHTLRRLG